MGEVSPGDWEYIAPEKNLDPSTHQSGMKDTGIAGEYTAFYSRTDGMGAKAKKSEAG